MQIMDLNEPIDHLAMENSVSLYGHPSRRKDGHVPLRT